MKLLTDTEINSAIKTVFPGCLVSIFPDHIDITLDIDFHPKFKDLNKLSDAVGTDEIDLVPGKHHPGYSYSSWTNEPSYDDPQVIRVYR